jgi:hypothetical protein
MSYPNYGYGTGLRNVGSYQASARPFLTSSLAVPSEGNTPLQVSFDSVTRFIIITNTLAGSVPNVPLRFGFSSNGTEGVENNNYAVLNNGESFEAEFRVTAVYLVSDSPNECSASVVAGLTGIKASHLADNWSGSLGVG